MYTHSTPLIGPPRQSSASIFWSSFLAASANTHRGSTVWKDVESEPFRWISSSTRSAQLNDDQLADDQLGGVPAIGQSTRFWVAYDLDSSYTS